LKPRPILFVLAGVNGAGKSSIGGHLLERAGVAWYNPHTFARELIAATGCDQGVANAEAWQEGMRRLDNAIAKRSHHAFETTLGGNTVAERILAATRSHDVLLWFCGLASPELHIARVKARVAAGGHDIPEAKIRERYPHAMHNLIGLMPYLAQLQVYDNSTEATAGGKVPDPKLLLQMERGKLIWPAGNDLQALRRIPVWAKSLVEAAMTPWK
jgi:predicted ABC-type ATPase